MAQFERRDWRSFDPNELTSITACDDAMFELDNSIADIEAQIAHDAASVADGAAQHGGRWRINATRALRALRALRFRIQSRRGMLATANKAAAQLRFERAFMDVAMDILPSDTIKRIFSEVNKAHPELAAP